jgi:hypothetical protein
MRAVLVLALGGLLTAAACPGPRPAPPPAAPDPECQPPGYHFAFLATDTRIYRQGSVVRLTPMVDVSPAGTRELPLRCTSGWSVSGPARLGADRNILTIDPEAPVGATVAVGFRHAGGPVEARLRVIGRDEVVLTGRRSQRGVEGCAGADRVGELEFGAENRFSVTFTPFETYRDYWGAYAFDPATGALRLTVEGGNFVPPNLDLEGRAELSADGLVLSGMFLGSRQGYAPPGGCTYRF